MPDERKDRDESLQDDTPRASRVQASMQPADYTDEQAARVTEETDDESRAGARKGAIFLGFVVVAYVMYLVFSGQMGSFLDALAGVNKLWVFGAAGCFVMYFVFGVLAYAVAVYIDHDSPVGVRDLMSVEASGIFFGNLTPMMAGAIPSQIVRLTRTGLDPGEASATQFTRFIMFQMGVVVFAAAMLLAEFPFFRATYGNIVFINLFVFGIHALELIGLFVICLCPGFVRRIGNALIAFAHKRGWLKNYDKWNEMVNVQVQEFADTFKVASTNLLDMFVTLVVTLCQLACLYMIPWFVLRAFGIEADFLKCMAAGSMVQMVATAVPLPGGTGGAEGGFALFFGPLFGGTAAAGYLVWRVVTFIAPTLVAFPLLSLKSRRERSIYERVQSLLHKSGGEEPTEAEGLASAKGPAATKAAATTKSATTAKTAGGAKVRVSSGGKLKLPFRRRREAKIRYKNK